MYVYMYGLFETLCLRFTPRDFPFTIEAKMSLEKILNIQFLT